MYAYVGNNPVSFLDPSGRVIVAAGNEEQRQEVLGLFQTALREAGAEDAADSLSLEKKNGIYVISTTSKDLASSENATASLIGSAIGVSDNISARLTDAPMKQFGGARTNSVGTRDHSCPR